MSDPRTSALASGSATTAAAEESTDGTDTRQEGAGAVPAPGAGLPGSRQKDRAGRRSRSDLSFTQRFPNIGAHVVLMIGSAVMLFPFVWQLIMSLSTQGEITSVPPQIIPERLNFENYVAVFQQMPFLQQLGVSVSTTVIRVVGQLLFCSMAGYAFARMRFPGRNILFGVFLSILMVPGQIFLVPQYEIIRSMGLLNTIAGISLPGIFIAFGVFLFRQHFMSMPLELEESARLDGANPAQTFFRVMLPLSGPAASALIIITTLGSWNDLMWPLVIATYEDRMPLSVGLASFSGQYATNYPVLMAASLMAMLPIFILFLSMQRRFVEGLAQSGVKG